MVRRVNSTVASNSAGWSRNPGAIAEMMAGMKISASTVSATMIRISQASVLPAKRSEASRPSRSSFFA